MVNKEFFQGQWNEIKGKVKQQWGKLTDDDLTRIDGKRDELLGSLQKKYGYEKERAEEELSRFEKTYTTAHSARDTEHSTRDRAHSARDTEHSTRDRAHSTRDFDK
jgi:uncharacterized protein YjbJ (UPF0337 family)